MIKIYDIEIDFLRQIKQRQCLQPFCFDDSGKLYLCDAIDYGQKIDYHLPIALIENGIVRSRASVMITVNNVNDNGPSLDPKASIGYILENSPIHTAIMRINVMKSDIFSEKPSLFKYEIADSHLSQVIN